MSLNMNETHYNLVIVGTGFASTFFLKEFLHHADKNAKILVLEKGQDLSYDWKLSNKTNSNIHFDSLIHNSTPQKPWVQNIAFGGGACWTGNTPRMHPSDFKTKTLHDIGEDWPFDYDSIENYYSEVESIMQISGGNSKQYPRKQPYPLKAHKLNTFDKLLSEKHQEQEHFFPMPSARASEPNNSRPVCCNNGVCSICPIGAKFQIDLHMRDIYKDPRVILISSATVTECNIEAAKAKGVLYEKNNVVHYVNADIVAIGAHAIMTPHILLRSGLTDFALGKYLNEQISVNVRVNLSGIDSYDGSQRVSGLGTMFLNEESRSHTAGCSVESYNVPWLRAEFGKWRQVAFLKFVFEDIPSENNTVSLSADYKPSIHYRKHSTYMTKGIKSISSRVEQLLNGLPVEQYTILDNADLGGSAHIQGTTRMGNSPNNSVVDSNLIHHNIRNLAILGAGAFPTCPTANPTLTLAALSIRSARSLF
jgi:choline dehydrogenase-like flavoprotein